MAGEHWTTKFLKTAWDLLRGNAKYRFCALLVRFGTTLVLGPPLLAIIATRILDAKLGADGVADALAVGSFIIGILMISGGTLLFLKQPDGPTPLPDAATYMPDPGETFHTFARMLIIESRKKTPRIEGFSDLDLARPLEPGTVLAGNGIQLIRDLGAKVRDPSTFPRYEVIEGETTITIRKTS